MSMSRFPNALMSLSSPSSVVPPSTSKLWSTLQQSIDNAVRGGFKHERNIFFVALIVSTGIVVVGLVLEEAPLWFPGGKPRLNILDGTFSPSPLLKWRKILEVFGWILILLGVIGEGVFEGATSIADGFLQDFGDVLLVAAQRDAGNAATSARTAHEEADAVKTEADALKTELSSLKQRTKQLRIALSDRVFIDRQGAGQRLRQFGQRNLPRQTMLKVKLEYLTTGCGDECKQLADQFKRVLGIGFANWMIEDPVPNRNREQFFEGVSIHTRCDPSSPAEKKWLDDAANALVKELNNNQHIKASREQDECFEKIPGIHQFEMLIRVGWRLGPSIPHH